MALYFFEKAVKIMKKACRYCGKIHDKKHICEQKPPPMFRGRNNPGREDIFRWSYDWKMKRTEIMKRDRYLCLACFNSLRGTVKRLNNEELSVHHIRPLRTSWEQRLDNRNLITLCRMHHEAAESGLIPAKILLKIVRGIPPEG